MLQTQSSNSNTKFDASAPTSSSLIMTEQDIYMVSNFHSEQPSFSFDSLRNSLDMKNAPQCRTLQESR